MIKNLCTFRESVFLESRSKITLRIDTLDNPKNRTYFLDSPWNDDIAFNFQLRKQQISRICEARYGCLLIILGIPDRYNATCKESQTSGDDRIIFHCDIVSYQIVLDV
jgi:hypothetical protein